MTKLKIYIIFSLVFMISFSTMAINFSTMANSFACRGLWNQEDQVFKVELRPLKSEDLEDFWIWASDQRVTKSLFWDAYTTKEAALDFLNKVANPHPWFMAILVDGRPVGAVTLDQRTGGARIRAELGYVLAFDYWGKGIVTEAVKLAIAKGFQELPIERIEALVDPDNLGSVKVLENAGLKREGLLQKYVLHRGIVRDRYIYAVTKNR